MYFSQNMSHETTEQPKPKKLGMLASGENVYDRLNSHLHNIPILEVYLPLALQSIDTENRPFIVETVDFNKVIGESECVETKPGDEIIYAQRPGRAGLSRFVRGEKAPTSKLTVVLKKVEDGYITLTAYVGEKSEPEPWDKVATPASVEFWNTHALVWGSQEIIPGTERSDLP